jgi:catechol 2,3-dioxygenase-like lactoylglutathione lyase family enzyme
MSLRLRTIMLYVRDVARSTAFYTTFLDAMVLPDYASEWFAMLDLPGGPPLALFDVAQGLPAGVSAAPGGFELDFEVDDIEAIYQDWRGKGVELATEIFSSPVGNMRLFYAKDPDGHPLAIYQMQQTRAEP